MHGSGRGVTCLAAVCFVLEFVRYVLEDFVVTPRLSSLSPTPPYLIPLCDCDYHPPSFLLVVHLMTSLWCGDRGRH